MVVGGGDGRLRVKKKQLKDLKEWQRGCCEDVKCLVENHLRAETDDKSDTEEMRPLQTVGMWRCLQLTVSELVSLCSAGIYIQRHTAHTVHLHN